MKPLLKVFDRFLSEGLKPLALYKNTKIPMLKNWNSNWNQDSNRELLKLDYTNIGLLLGDIVDVEGDSEKANDVINDLIGNYEHPVYKSKKSFHHLFINPDPNLTLLKFDDIEFRGKNHQSVIPPSKINDVVYEWVHLIFPFPVMPKNLLDFYLSNRKKIIKNNSKKPGHIEVNCSICRKKSFINKKRWNYELIAFKEIDFKLLWQCRNCRKYDLRPRVRNIKKISKKNENIVDWRDWFHRV